MSAIGTREIVAVCFALFFIANLFWRIHIAYPLILDRSIRKGKSWIYIPLRWRGLHKKLVSLTTPVLNALIVVLGLATLWYFVYPKSELIFAASAAGFVILHLFLSAQVLKLKLRQQEDSYFFIRRKLFEDMEVKGKKLTESEIGNLASFQHQSLLREADKTGQLGPTISKQSKTAKEQKKNRKESSKAEEIV